MGPISCSIARGAVAAIALLALTVPTSSHAASTSKASRPSARPSVETRCEALLGNAAQRQHNRTRREQRLHFVDESVGSVTVAHSTDSWRSPQPIAVPGLRVVGLRGSGDEGHALVRLAPDSARRLGCRAGTYTVQVDDNLGPLRVLSVLHNMLLVEHGERLAYLPKPGTPEPSFVLAWGSRYRVIVSASPSASSSGRSPYSSYRPYRPSWRRRIYYRRVIR